jgi:hypothetical protein
MYTEFWWGNLKEGGHWEDPGMDGRITIKMHLQDMGWEAWAGSIWLRIGTDGGLL